MSSARCGIVSFAHCADRCLAATTVCVGGGRRPQQCQALSTDDVPIDEPVCESVLASLMWNVSLGLITAIGERACLKMASAAALR